MNAVSYSYGWAWQGAATSSNIVLLNTAFEKEKYEYLFDRCLELGNDTVLLKKEEIGKHGGSFDMVLDAAKKVGYQLYTETNDMLIFHMDTPKNFGVKTEYTGLAIGTYASHISLVYPEFQLGTKRYLDEYTLEELAKYKVIYLSGFDYRNKYDAETLVALLSEQGVRVIIDMSHIPLDQRSQRKSFLSIMAQDIFFEAYFPTLFYRNQEWNTDYFPEDYKIWNTCYVEGAPIEIGSVDYNNQNLVFAGMSENENVIYLGFNLLFYATESEDEVVYQILDDLFLMQRGVLPKRTLVPMDITYSNRSIIIDSVEENLNTTIAFQDNFESVDGIINENNLLGVTRKHTVISLVYPHKKIALFVNIIGVIVFLRYLSYLEKSSIGIRIMLIGTKLNQTKLSKTETNFRQEKLKESIDSITLEGLMEHSSYVNEDEVSSQIMNDLFGFEVKDMTSDSVDKKVKAMKEITKKEVEEDSYMHIEIMHIYPDETKKEMAIASHTITESKTNIAQEESTSLETVRNLRDTGESLDATVKELTEQLKNLSNKMELLIQQNTTKKKRTLSQQIAKNIQKKMRKTKKVGAKTKKKNTIQHKKIK